ncbi:histidine phosphatase family protein [Ktedonobacter racemifer]|uniref:Phosphoglycerate mutase n=1 Tax=Ktedonobacter racemifer DSM 44963 TaxID=485913 RepID=D6U6U3_KTERA|nr:histidine phosphatase family protein [Ktedonobacter racemifer]EFH80704.1 Phosphoglycerate mutase [Ktedonobacter racemifer DSM 44963]
MSTQYTNTIYLIRHGENLANVTGEFSYKRVDYSLTAKGVLQAQQTAAHLHEWHIDEFFSSPLKRARETAEIIAEPHHLPVTLFEEFRELNVGDLEDAAPTAENWDYHNNILAQWYHGHLDVSFPNGESFLTLTERGKQGLHKVTWGKQGRVIAIAGHAAIFTALVSAICGPESLETIRRGKKHNCSISEIELTTSEHNVVGRLVQWAACAHLSGEAANFVPAVPEFKKQSAETEEVTQVR